MKKIFTLSILNVFTVLVAFSQTQFQKDYEAIRTELVTWDAVRGEWLANSFEAMANKQSIPERTFPEDLTPNELYRLVPKSTKQNIQSIVTNNSSRATETSQRDAWRKVAIMTETSICKPLISRSYGDPHLVSFDGASFSFQTVGEFIMTKSQSGHMEVQSRQRASGENFSLNSALAMNVAGDRFCVYPNEKPDNLSNSPFRLNGNPITISTNTYNLPRGGSVVKTGKNDYVVNWPSGERVVFDIRNSSSFDFINLQIEILPCLDERFDGVLGNANGMLSDDFKTRTNTVSNPTFISFVSFNDNDANRINQDLERAHLNFIAKDFANEWRVTNENTLFDYGFGQNTLTFTDYNFPRVHLTLDNLTPDQQQSARRSCEEAGITGAELRGCIYDRGFLDIPANPRPIVKDRTEGVVLAKLEKPNNKPVDKNQPVDKPIEEIKGKEIKSDGESKNDAKPISNSTGNGDKPVVKKDKTSTNKEKDVEEKEENTSIFDLFNSSNTKEEKSNSNTNSTKEKSSTNSNSTPVNTPVEKKSTSTPTTTIKPTNNPVTKPSTPATTTPIKKGKG